MNIDEIKLDNIYAYNATTHTEYGIPRIVKIIDIDVPSNSVTCRIISSHGLENYTTFQCSPELLETIGICAEQLKLLLTIPNLDEKSEESLQICVLKLVMNEIQCLLNNIG
jgi:hypothetical protein